MNGIGFSRREFIGGAAAFSVAGCKTGGWHSVPGLDKVAEKI